MRADLMLHFYNATRHASYEAAEAAREVYVCEAPADEDQVDSWGFDGGILCDAMQAINTALQCAGFTDRMEAVLFSHTRESKTRLMAWSDET
jgi:hypothetical protein